MPIAVRLKTKITGDKQMFLRVGERHKHTRPLMQAVGVLGMTAALQRLTKVLKMDAEGVRTGNLSASVRVGMGGGPRGMFGPPVIRSRHTVFEATARRVEVGSNLEYAAQVHHGGTITPSTVKNLAIPIPPKLKRAGRWPRDIDPSRERLEWRPGRGGNSGVLVDPTGDAGFGKGVLFVLKRQVVQKPRPFLYWADEQQRILRDDIYPTYLGLN